VVEIVVDFLAEMSIITASLLRWLFKVLKFRLQNKIEKNT